MAASITTSTRFSSVVVFYDTIRKIISGIGWTIDATPTDYGNARLEYTGIANTTDDEDNLAVLQEIYASTNGFQDTAGNSITPTLDSYEYPITVAELEANGIVNPLIAGYEDRIENKRKMLGYEAQGLVKAKTVDGREQVEHGVDFVTKDFAPKTENYNYPMRRWLVYEETSTQFWVELLIPKHHAVDSSLLNDYPPILAFKAWLADIKQSGSAVGTDVTDSAGLSGRNFDIPVSGGRLRVRYGNRGQSQDSDSDFSSIRFRFDRQSSGSTVDVDTDDLREYFQALTISLESANITVPVSLGDPNAILKCQRIDIDENRSLELLHNQILYHGKVVRSGRLYTLPIGPSWGIGLRYEELAIINTIHHIPFLSDMNAVHIYGLSADGIIQIDNPRTLVRYPGTDRQIAIHNIDDTYDVEVRDWDADEILTLQPGEHFEFRISLDQNGRTGRMIDEHLPKRILHQDYHSSNDGSGEAFTDGFWDVGTIDFRLIPFDGSDNGIEHYADDAFLNRQGSHPTVSQGDLDGELFDSFNYEGVAEILLDGLLDIRWDIRIITDSTGSGSIGGYNAFRLYHFPADGNNPVSVLEDISGGFSGSDAEVTYGIEYFGREVKVGDRIFAGLRHYSNSLNWSHVRVTDQNRYLELTIPIKKEWAA